MRLTQHTDFALRTLIYLASHDEDLVQTAEISSAYGISQNHLVKVVQTLQQHGFVEVRRGRGGGIRLARASEQINIAEVIRASEKDFFLVECFDKEKQSCPISGVCSYKAVLNEALQAFIAVFEKYNLAYFVSRPGREIYRKLLSGD